MSDLSIWPAFGFSDNPYNNNTLPGDESGSYLLVGRDAEVSSLMQRVASGGTHPAVEGPVGVGKSSLIAVAGYRMLEKVKSDHAGTLFLPVPQFFSASESMAEFEDEGATRLSRRQSSSQIQTHSGELAILSQM